MNRILAREIVQRLRPSADGERAVPLGAYDRPVWQRTLTWLDRSGLALYFWQHVKGTAADGGLPSEVSTQLARNLADNRARVSQMAEECHLLNRLFENARVDYALLKGFAMFPDYCPDVSLRAQYDHDYLLRLDSLGRVGEILQAAGYRRKGQKGCPRVYFRAALPPFLPSGRDDLYSARLGRLVELHFKLWETDVEKICFPTLEDALDRACSKSCDGLCFSALADEDALVYQVLHTFRHILNNWCRLSIFLEIARFLQERSSDYVIWERFRERTKDWPQLRLAAGVVFSLAAGLFTAPVPAAVSAWTTKALTPALSQWVTRYGLESAFDNFRGNKFSLFLHREFIQDAPSWREIQRKRLFPLQGPPRAVQAASRRFYSRLAVTWKEFGFVVRRVAFHLGSALRYAWELPTWRRMVRRQSLAPSAPQKATRSAPD